MLTAIIVYLIIGITFFNFYSEATNGGSLSIITNASLIKKVYVPKYIYPLSQVFSASINFGISLILMFGVALVNGLMPNIYFLLIPFAMLSIFILNTGVALLLATGMTFFRDVQFIYNVFMTALTYATPMFWDMSMIPDKYNWIFKINPLAVKIITRLQQCVNTKQAKLILFSFLTYSQTKTNKLHPILYNSFSQN